MDGNSDMGYTQNVIIMGGRGVGEGAIKVQQ